MKIKSERHRETETWYESWFEYSSLSGCAFPCDEQGNVLLDKMQPEAIANYEDCINGLRPGYRDVGVRKMSHSWTANAIGICDICGTDVELYDGYMGACQCPKWPDSSLFRRSNGKSHSNRKITINADGGGLMAVLMHGSRSQVRPERRKRKWISKKSEKPCRTQQIMGQFLKPLGAFDNSAENDEPGSELY